MSELNFDELEPEIILDSEVPNWKASKPAKETLREKVRRGATAPSNERAEARRPKAAPKAPTAKHGAFTAELEQIYTYVGMGLMVVDEPCGTAVISSAEQCAKSLDDLAFTNPAVRRALMSLTQTSAVGAVILAHMPILTAVAMHHGGALLRSKVKEPENVTVPATEV